MSDKQPAKPAQTQHQHQGPTQPHPHPHPERDVQVTLTGADMPKDAGNQDPKTFNGRHQDAHAAWHKQLKAKLAAKNPTG